MAKLICCATLPLDVRFTLIPPPLPPPPEFRADPSQNKGPGNWGSQKNSSPGLSQMCRRRYGTTSISTIVVRGRREDFRLISTANKDFCANL